MYKIMNDLKKTQRAPKASWKTMWRGNAELFLCKRHMKLFLILHNRVSLFGNMFLFYSNIGSNNNEMIYCQEALGTIS